MTNSTKTSQAVLLTLSEVIAEDQAIDAIVLTEDEQTIINHVVNNLNDLEKKANTANKHINTFTTKVVESVSTITDIDLKIATINQKCTIAMNAFYFDRYTIANDLETITPYNWLASGDIKYNLSKITKCMSRYLNLKTADQDTGAPLKDGFKFACLQDGKGKDFTGNCKVVYKDENSGSGSGQGADQTNNHGENSGDNAPSVSPETDKRLEPITLDEMIFHFENMSAQNQGSFFKAIAKNKVNSEESRICITLNSAIRNISGQQSEVIKQLEVCCKASDTTLTRVLNAA